MKINGLKLLNHLYAFKNIVYNHSDRNSLRWSACLGYSSLHQKAIVFQLAFIGKDCNLELQQ